jgi:hypothetical protein
VWEVALRLVVGIAAFLTPVVLVLAAAAQEPGAGNVRPAVKRGAEMIFNHFAFGLTAEQIGVDGTAYAQRAQTPKGV